MGFIVGCTITGASIIACVRPTGSSSTFNAQVMQQEVGRLWLSKSQLLDTVLVGCMHCTLLNYHSMPNTCTSQRTFVYTTSCHLLYTTYMYILLTDNMEGVIIYHPQGDGEYQQTAR